jgi:hypothetical protein
MRTTLTLDDDVAARIEQIRREQGIGLREVVNTLLRRGLDSPGERPAPAVRVPTFPGLRPRRADFDRIGDVLGELDDERPG